MKKVIALLIASIMVFGAGTTAFAQPVIREIKHNVLIDGDKKTFTLDEGISVDKLTMFTAECYQSKFGCPTITAENITKAKAFTFNGREYYALRDVAQNCDLKVFWDSATATTLVVENDTYEKIHSLIEASNEKSQDFKKLEIGMNGNIDFKVSAAGIPETSMALPLEADIKFDMEAPFMAMDVKVKSNEMPMEVSMYDDGKKMYMNAGEATWIEMDSSLAQSAQMIEQFETMNPAKDALAVDLSIAGLKLQETPEGYIIEGDMYVAETFKGIDIDAIVNQMYEQSGVEMGLKYDWPDIMYVKYTMDKEGNIKEMHMKFTIGMAIEAEGQSIQIGMDVDMNIPKFIIDGDFETVVPQTVLDNLVSDEPAGE